jgi:hypothetical protein
MTDHPKRVAFYSTAGLVVGWLVLGLFMVAVVTAIVLDRQDAQAADEKRAKIEAYLDRVGFDKVDKRCMVKVMDGSLSTVEVDRIVSKSKDLSDRETSALANAISACLVGR